MKFISSLLTILFVFAMVKTNAQDEGNKDNSNTADTTGVQAPDWNAIKKRLAYGGNIGLSFLNDGGTNFTIFQLSPQIGYKITDDLIAGTGLQFMSISSKYSKYLQYGPDFFIRAHAGRFLFGQAQLEYINFEDYLLPGKRVWNPAFLVGAGYGTYGYSIGLYTNLINNRFNEYIYPANIYIGGRAFLLRGELLF
jgi:hypothetical protein